MNLKLQTDKKHLQAIIGGEVDVEKRNIYPSNAGKYVAERDFIDDNGEQCFTADPVVYDTITFVSGRRDGAPSATVKVKASEFVVLTDENGDDLMFEQDGIEYYVCQVWYTLGEVISTENIQQ